MLSQQIELYSRTLNYCDPRRFSSYFATQDTLNSYYRENIARLIDIVSATNEEKLLVLKDPLLSLVLDDLRILYPTARIISLIRDPRDVLASMKKVFSRSQPNWDLDQSIVEIFQYYFKLEEHLNSAANPSLVFRYEDLVSDGIESVVNLLGSNTRWNSEGQHTMAEMKQRIDHDDPFLSEHYFEPTTKQTIGSYKEILTPPELGKIESVFGGIITRWRYV